MKSPRFLSPFCANSLRVEFWNFIYGSMKNWRVVLPLLFFVLCEGVRFLVGILQKKKFNHLRKWQTTLFFASILIFAIFRNWRGTALPMAAGKSICSDSFRITSSNNGLVNQAALSGERTDVRLPFCPLFFTFFFLPSLYPLFADGCAPLK